MKLHALMVTRNEADRYLSAVIRQLVSVVDDVFVYDDRSTDDTTEAALEAGAQMVVSRPHHEPSFLKHEGHFRQAAWRCFEQWVDPEMADWVLAVDADEFLAVDDAEDDLHKAVHQLTVLGRNAAAGVILPIHEVFAVEGGRPLIRTDGFWSSTAAPRLFPYQPNGIFADRAMGCGSTPTYVSAGPLIPTEAHEVSVLHYGYAVLKDQKAKWERYAGMANHGHSPAHIDSILTTPRLETWEGSLPLQGAR